VGQEWFQGVRSLLDGPSPAVLTTYRQDGSALVTPVWFRWVDGAFEVVIAEGDVKLRHLARDPRCIMVVFEAVPPFRGVEVRGVPELIEGDVTEARIAIASRYLGASNGERFAEERRAKPGVLLRLVPDKPRVWDLSGILPTEGGEAP
jgi:PPOX class probable F420-dependent enzyme